MKEETLRLDREEETEKEKGIREEVSLCCVCCV